MSTTSAYFSANQSAKARFAMLVFAALATAVIAALVARHRDGTRHGFVPGWLQMDSAIDPARESAPRTPLAPEVAAAMSRPVTLNALPLNLSAGLARPTQARPAAAADAAPPLRAAAAPPARAAVVRPAAPVPATPPPETAAPEVRPVQTAQDASAVTPMPAPPAAAAFAASPPAMSDAPVDDALLEQIEKEAAALSVASSGLPSQAYRRPASAAGWTGDARKPRTDAAVSAAPENAAIETTPESTLASESLARWPGSGGTTAPPPAAATPSAAFTPKPIAPQKETPAPTQDTGNAAQSYLQTISHHLGVVNDRILAESLQAGSRDVVEVRFAIDRSGRVLRAGVSAPSSDAAADQRATRVVMAASPLPPPPREIGGDRIELRFAVEIYR